MSGASKIMAKKIEQSLQEHSLEKADDLIDSQLNEDRKLLKFAEQAQTDETVKLSIEELRTRVQNNAN